MNNSYEIELTPFKQENVPETVRWVNDAEIMRLIDRSPEPVTLDGCYKWCESILEDERNAMFAIVMRGNKRHIGNCGLSNIDKRALKAKLWIYIGEKDMWGNRIGKRALEQLLVYSFGKLKLNKVYLYIVAGNIRAQKLYESSGFIKEGIFKQDTFVEGKFEDVIYYGILKSEFKEKYGKR